jgi:hypothetical protein
MQIVDPTISSQEEEVKVCTSCGIEKPFSEFWKHPLGRHGLRPRCKTCLNAQIRSYQRANPEKLRAATKRWYDRDPERARRMARDQKAKNPRRERAHRLVREAVRRGEIVRPVFCSTCGRSDLRIEAHHEDYDMPLDVNWLCSSCHGATHAKKGRR